MAEKIRNIEKQLETPKTKTASTEAPLASSTKPEYVSENDFSFAFEAIF
jgi:hypothetical protein